MIGQINIKVINYRLMNKPELFDLVTNEPIIGLPNQIFKNTKEENEYEGVLPYDMVIYKVIGARKLYMKVRNGVAGHQAIIDTSS